MIFAAEEGGGFNPLSVQTGLYVWTTLAFLVVLYFLATKVFPKLQESLADREQKIKGDLEQAEAAKAEAEQLREQVNAQLSQARQEAGQIAAQIKQSAEAAAKETLAKGEQEAQEVVQKAIRELDAERERTVSELKSDIGQMAVELASKIVEKELNPQSHQALVDSFIADLSKQGATSPS
ncbi:MAG: F0F1 ATP synthase subunit B [Actinomycetota bacterium]